MDLLRNIWHVVRSEAGIQRLKALPAWQKRAGLNLRVLLLQHQPEAPDYSVSEGSPLLLGRLDASSISTPRVPVTVIRGNFEVGSHAPRYETFRNFGRVFWSTLVNALQLEERDVLQLHSLSLGFLMAENPRLLGEGPGVVLSPRFSDPEANLAFIDYILQRDKLPPEARAVFEPLKRIKDGTGRIQYPLDRGFVFMGLPTAIEDVDALTAVYLQSVYGIGFQFSLNLTQRASDPVVDRLIIVTPEKEGSIPQRRKELLTGSIAKDPVLGRLYNPDGITVIGLSDTPSPTGDPDIIPWGNIRGNLPAYIHMLRRAVNSPGVDQKCTVVMTEAGMSTRLPNGEDNKGSTQIGETNLRNAGLCSLIHLIRQSPEGGKGKIFLAGVDNINAGHGPLTTGWSNLLCHAPYGMMLVMRPHKVNSHELGELAKYKQRGTAIADPRTGRIRLMLEKEDPEALSKALDEARVSDLLENTMWQMISVEFARKILEVFDQPCYAALGKSLVQHYGILDFSADLVSPQTITSSFARGQYKEKLKERCKKEGIAFDERDAEMILNGTAELSRLSGGLGAIEVGFFSDAGDFAAYTEFHELLLNPSPTIRGLRDFLRFASGLNLYQNIHLPTEAIHIVGTDGVIHPDKINIHGDPETIYIGEGVSMMPGTIIHPYTMIVQASQFEVPMALPSHLLVSGAKILAPLDFSQAADPGHTPPWRLIYNLTVQPNYRLSLPNDAAMVGFRLPGKTTKSGKVLRREQIGFFPISIALKRDSAIIDPATGEPVKDPVFGYYPLITSIPDSILTRGTEYSWVKFAADVIPFRETIKA
jgi:hypothetical protein